MGDNDGAFGGWIFAFLIIAIIFGGGNFFGNKDNGTTGAVDMAEINARFNQQDTNMQFQALQSGIATAAAANQRQYSELMLGNMQSFNALNIANLEQANNTNMVMMNGFNGVNSQINDLAHQMESCCCALKSQMLEDKYERVQAELLQAQGVVANATQTQNILNALGRYYPVPPVSPCSGWGGCNC